MEQFRNRLNQPPEPRQDFLEADSYLFAAEKLATFDAESGVGSLIWKRYRRKPRVAFNHMTMPVEEVEAWEFPAAYPEPKSLPFRISFVDEGTVRLQMRSFAGAFDGDDSIMLDESVRGKVPSSSAWKLTQKAGVAEYTSSVGKVVLTEDPWSIRFYDASGKLLLETRSMKDGRCMISGRPVPFSFARRSGDLRQSFAASFSLQPSEKLFGGGESFTRLDKRGQTLSICTQDAHGTQTGEMYKPIPFHLSSRGYGVFTHASTPMNLDLGDSYGDTQVVYNGDDSLDLFIFLGSPGEVLTRYTALTGRSPVPPLWSFGLWMSRITYESEKQTREIAAKLREHRIPCDVIHLDTGWFETDWCCNYEFAPTRFENPTQMLGDLAEQGFHVSLWQLPYFTPNNPLHTELLEGGLFVKGLGGAPPNEDTIIDFTNPAAVQWYQGKLGGLLEQGVGAIKVDFGEGAPVHGVYHNGHTGWYEHNLYPLRYNAAAAEVTEQLKGYSLIWARSAYAGSQRYPLHWGGDAEASDGGMLGSLWGGLSLGLCGFSFWSHDVGGFFPATPRDLYLRWLPFGALLSHARCHGLPPTEPWEFDDEFMDVFRRTVELRYRLLPYLWSQAHESAQAGHPLLRPLFFEFPEDPGSWQAEDVYLLGDSLLVAPLFEEVRNRDVYLPPGTWVDAQSERSYEGGRWVNLEAGDIPALILLRAGQLIPTAPVAQHTGELDWDALEVWQIGDAKDGRVYLADGTRLALELRDGKVLADGKARTGWTLRRLDAK